MDSLGIYEYSSKDLIGHGAFAVVYKGRLKKRPSQTVAIKAITKKNLAKSQNLLGKEIKILKELTELHHDNVVALLDCKETPNHVYLVMEYCNGGDLADYLNAKGTLSEDTIRLFLRQLAGAISAMVSKDIVHRDLKPQNILLHHDGRTRNPMPQDIKLKIADFGFARFLQDGVMAATLCGSPMYMAPEVIMSLQYNSKADLWSLGTIVFQCLTGKAPFQAQTPQALKHFYEKNASLAPKIPPGTSKELTDLLMGLLRRNAKDRLEFDVFFNHPFIQAPRSPTPPPTSSESTPVEHHLSSTPPRLSTTPPRTRPVPVPTAKTVGSGDDATPKNYSSPINRLPPSPVVAPTRYLGASPSKDFYPKAPIIEKSTESSPDAGADDFVMVPDHLTMDAAENRKKASNVNLCRASPITARRQQAAVRPVSLPVHQQSEALPVPAQKGTYQQIQQSLTRSRTKSGDSVSAMSGVSSASGGSTLGPITEEGASAQSPSGVVRRARAASLSSPNASPKANKNENAKTRRISAPIPDICQISPPHLQYTMGTPPLGHRRRTSSSSSCGTPPPALQWATSPAGNPGRIASANSPIRRTGSGGSQTNLFSNIPCLSPILGSPNKSTDVQGPSGGKDQSRAVIHWNNNSNAMRNSKAVTVPENLCDLGGQFCPQRGGEFNFGEGRNVVLNYGQPQGDFERSSSLTSLTRRHSLAGDKENLAPSSAALILPDFSVPPPDLSEETLLAPEHNEILAKLKFISQYVDTVIDVARCKAAPLSVFTEASGASGGNMEQWNNGSPLNRRVQQLLLYMRCLHLLSQCLEFARAELKSKRLKPSTTVKNVLATLNERFRHCISMTKMLNSENLLNEFGLDPQNSAITADRILYQYAIEQCQSAALDELFGNPGECFQRYYGAHILLHALEQHSKSSEDKNALTKYRDAVEKRLAILSDQGFITAYETFSH